MKEHTISYAYPTSSDATRLGYASTGCHIVTVEGKEATFQNLKAALLYALLLETAPSIWSMDNKRFLLDGIECRFVDVFCSNDHDQDVCDFLLTAQPGDVFHGCARI